MAYRLLGKDFTPSDVVAKVTGSAKYAEDFRVDGMLFSKLWLSPMPHGRVRNIDASEALAMDGVIGILTADDLPETAEPNQPVLTNEPMYVGQPILALAAVDETIAANAIDKIKVDLQPLPFVLDPLDSLHPGGEDASENGNVVVAAQGGAQVKRHKWTARDFARVGEGELPLGEPTDEWSYGDIDAGFAESKVIVEESFVTASTSHHCMEPRTTMSYWDAGKCYVYGSTQSSSFAHPFLAGMVGVTPDKLVFISEYCGGGFGSKLAAYPTMAIPALLSKKVGRPVMMRINREEESYIGSSRAGLQGRIKIGFRADGRVAATDLYLIHDNGPYGRNGDFTAAANAVSIIYQPLAMRFRGIPVMTNTPPKGPQRGPGENQIAAAVEPMIDEAARQLGLDRVAIRKMNAPDQETGKVGANRDSLTSARMKEALDMGADMFKWAEASKRSGQVDGHKVRGVGIGQAWHSAGYNGFDGLVRIASDGKLHLHTGCGNLGTFSFAATSRVAAEVLGAKWENCVVERGDSRRNLPWNIGQFGSNTSFTMTRTMYVGAMDAKRKLQEIAAMDLGGDPDDYDVADERVSAKSDASRGLSFAEAADRAIALGGKFDGHEMPDDINDMTKASVTAMVGTGLIGVAKDNLEKKGTVPALAVGFIEIELDTETGQVEILDYVGVGDAGTILHPMSFNSQVLGGAVMGFGMACFERHQFDAEFGRPANRAIYQAKPPTYMDVPLNMRAAGVDIPDPQNPVGAKGIGEPVLGCAASALTAAISDAMGGYQFKRVPIQADMIVNALAGNPQLQKDLQLNT